jgi:hypothetical protein
MSSKFSSWPGSREKKIFKKFSEKKKFYFSESGQPQNFDDISAYMPICRQNFKVPFLATFDPYLITGRLFPPIGMHLKTCAQGGQVLCRLIR